MPKKILNRPRPALPPSPPPPLTPSRCQDSHTHWHSHAATRASISAGPGCAGGSQRLMVVAAWYGNARTAGISAAQRRWEMHAARLHTVHRGRSVKRKQRVLAAAGDGGAAMPAISRPIHHGLATRAAMRGRRVQEIPRTLSTPRAHRLRPESPAMNTVQRTLCKIPPRWWFAAIEAESRVWMVRCGCGLARSLWTAGGMRGKGAGTGHWLMRCPPKCGRRFWHRISCRDATDRPPPGASEGKVSRVGAGWRWVMGYGGARHMRKKDPAMQASQGRKILLTLC